MAPRHLLTLIPWQLSDRSLTAAPIDLYLKNHIPST